MPNLAIGTTEVADFIPELWASTALGMLPSYLNLAKTVNRDFDDEVAQQGDTIHISKRGALTAKQKVSGEDYDLQNPTGDKVDVTVDQLWYVSFVVEDIAKAQSKPKVMEGYVEDSVLTLGEKVESKLADLYVNAGDYVDAGSAIELAEILSVRKKLSDAKLPKTAPRYAYVDSSSYNDLLAIDAFTDVSKYGANTAVMDGELGRLFGMKVFESQMVESAGSPAKIHNMVYGRDAMVLAMRPLPVDGNGLGVQQTVVTDPESGISMRVTYGYDMRAGGVRVTMDLLFGVAMMRPEFLIDLRRTA